MATRRYFAKFEKITAHLGRVAAVMQAEGALSKREVEVLTAYVQAIAYTFKALSMKYLLVGRDTGQFFGSLQMDVEESGFPMFSELMVMANDAAQARQHLEGQPDAETLKRQMVEQIISEREIPGVLAALQICLHADNEFGQTGSERDHRKPDDQ